MLTSEKFSFGLQNMSAVERVLFLGYLFYIRDSMPGLFYEKLSENHYSIKEASRLPSCELWYGGSAASSKWEGRNILQWGLETCSRSWDENPIVITKSCHIVWKWRRTSAEIRMRNRLGYKYWIQLYLLGNNHKLCWAGSGSRYSSFSRKTVHVLLSTCMGDKISSDGDVIGETLLKKKFLTGKKINLVCGAFFC